MNPLLYGALALLFLALLFMAFRLGVTGAGILVLLLSGAYILYRAGSPFKIERKPEEKPPPKDDEKPPPGSFGGGGPFG